MDYTIKELNQQGISKSLVYEALKNSLPFSNIFIKNKRIFNEKDLEIFKFYKEFWLEKTVSKHWKTEKIADNSSVSKQSLNSSEDIDTLIKKAVNNEIKTVKEQFESRENELLKEIKQKESIIEIKDNQTQKYALMKIQEEKEKKEWIEKYEKENEKKGEWIRKFYWIRTYLFVFIVLFCVSLIFSIFLIFWIIKL